ncbi:MAG: DUF2431 domain-containing protein [Nanoarchaeota archaeon]|nr:DUF2431 domain-containing protein [Nanoarchaeota archaeon]
MDIYEPREDSFLLEKWVKKLARGRCLDVGTGSGIQAQAALKKAREVMGVDINPAAVAQCRKSIPKAKFYVSDLFSYFDEQKDKRKFDTIIFNAPYLPAEGEKDAALDGGKEGHEIIARFLRESKHYLSKGGQILLIFSSLTKKEEVDKQIKKNKMKSEELEKIHVFFEDIFCYRVTWN